MPLFEVGENELIPFRRVEAGPDLYEKEIEDLMWSDLAAFVGPDLFPVARQPNVGDLRPDIVALDQEGHVHVVEVKRSVDRGQLAQCLEYAGWARETNLDELAKLFDGGPEAFFAAWCEFTDTEWPVLVQGPPWLVLVARDFDARTDAALRYLTEGGLPLTVLPVTILEDQNGQRFINIISDHEPESHSEAAPASAPSVKRFKVYGRLATVTDLLDEGLLEAGTPLTWTRPTAGKTHRASVQSDGQIQLEDGRSFNSLSMAAKQASDLIAAAGWHVWRLDDGTRLADLRDTLIELVEQRERAEADGLRD